MKCILRNTVLCLYLAAGFVTYAFAKPHHHTLENFFSIHQTKIFINVQKQTLYLLNSANRILTDYQISSGKNGTGETPHSGQTPRGLFYIEEKIGDGKNPMQAYNARKPSGIYNRKKPDQKGIISRIMTLHGAEKHNANTKSRYVYIHGTPFVKKLGGPPASQGCIRMEPHQIIDLYNRIAPHTPVYILDENNPHHPHVFGNDPSKHIPGHLLT